MTDNEKQLIIAEIGALEKNLIRIQNVFKNEEIPKDIRNQISGKFFRSISGIQQKLNIISQAVKTGNETLADCWNDLEEAQLASNRVFAQCLDFLGGIAVRRMQLDGGICDMAEELVRYYSSQTGVSWGSVMILGEERLFDEIARTTQIIRLRFPEWDVWSLPFTAYEFGLLVASEDDYEEMTRFYAAEGERIEHLTQDKDIPAAEVKGLALGLQELRTQRQAGYDISQNLKYQKMHMRSLFADAFATYVLGPAYVYSRLFLRLVPTSFDRDQSYEPSFLRRVAFMIGTLEKMNEEAAAKEREVKESGPYFGEIMRISETWRTTVQAVEPAYQGAFKLGAPYDAWFEQMYTNLVNPYSLAVFEPGDWKKAVDLGKAFEDTRIVDRSTTLPVILNAGWYARVRAPERLEDIGKRMAELLQQVVSAELPAEAPSAGPPRGGVR